MIASCGEHQEPSAERPDAVASGDEELIRLARLLCSGFWILVAALILHTLAVPSPWALTLGMPRWAAAMHRVWPWAECAAVIAAGLGLCRVEVAMSGACGYRGSKWRLLAAGFVMLMLMCLALVRLGRPESDWAPVVLTFVDWLKTGVAILALIWLADLLRRLTRILYRPWNQSRLLYAAMAIVVLSAIVKVALLTLGSIMIGIALRDGIDASALVWFRAHLTPFVLLQVGADLLWPLAALGVLLDGIQRLRRIGRGRCIRCGYDLQGAFGAGCSECGWRRDSHGTKT